MEEQAIFSTGRRIAIGVAHDPADAERTVPSLPPLSGRLALSVAEACAALGCSWDFFAEHVAPDLRVVRKGRRKLVSVEELRRWLDDSGERVRDGL